ncbi:phosphoribosyltransferase family protein [Brevibacterium sp. 50QC2O2]|uniref:phosphoribosyltransferase family protein n=1 Tax=unclassified Brevibacterium TaxID=2614124 RepID=UPI00211D077B|nr:MULTISPECIES: phosphoribosyltransferase family protein [unclassified Brevibacterium]MCQ9367191.1 phosphoribosyltransferase family protein [Brevibacterium sp. 91QC2O2]MCQ9389576.1 phosphoribosyltransferase family protein [Brevibacterium sp. 50QC2O2]
MTDTTEFWPLQVGSQTIDIPLVKIDDELTIALLMTIDAGVAFNETAGRELADKLRDFEPEIIVSAATLGIPVAIEVSRALGLDQYLILQKTRKHHLRDSPSVELTSITSANTQSLMLDKRRVPAVAGRRVVFVDDVISTGGSTNAALRLLDQVGANVVGIGAFALEGDAWKTALGERAGLVRALGQIPSFTSVEQAVAQRDSADR